MTPSPAPTLARNPVPSLNPSHNPSPNPNKAAVAKGDFAVPEPAAEEEEEEEEDEDEEDEEDEEDDERRPCARRCWHAPSSSSTRCAWH